MTLYSFEETQPNVFVAQGLSKFAPGIAVTKMMTVVRNGTELTVINSAKLDDDGAQALRALGTVKHLIRLGGNHGLDDGWFIERFKPTTWALPAQRLRAHGKHEHDLVEGAGALPIDARVFVFDAGQRDEAALLLSGDTLVTCDSLQAWRDTDDCTVIGGFMTKRMGFLSAPVIIGPIWLKHQRDNAGMRAQFERLLGLGFRHLIGGHGKPLRDHAHDHVAAAVRKAFA